MGDSPTHAGTPDRAAIETAATAATTAPPEPAAQEPPVGPDTPILAIMSTTRAMRRLAPDPVPDELIRSLIEAAAWAPTGSNAQGEAFVVVTDRPTIARLAALWRRVTDDFRMFMGTALPARPATAASTRIRESVDYQRDHFAETPVVVVACYDMREQRRGQRNPVRIVGDLARQAGPRRTAALLRQYPVLAQRSEAASIYPAVENLLLAARAHGLAACLTTWHLLAEAELKEILGIPKGVHTFAVIPIGWPLDKFGRVRRRSVDEVLHRDRW